MPPMAVRHGTGWQGRSWAGLVVAVVAATVTVGIAGTTPAAAYDQLPGTYPVPMWGTMNFVSDAGQHEDWVFTDVTACPHLQSLTCDALEWDLRMDGHDHQGQTSVSG